MFKAYLDYKRGFETDYLDYFSAITESPGSPFLNKFVTRSVSTCKQLGRGTNYKDCMRMIQIGLASCGELGGGGYYQCGYEIQEKLQLVEIYFDTPTFDKITRDAKMNDIAKLSMIGGTLGLLTGDI